MPAGFRDVRDLTAVGEMAAPRRNAGIGIDRIESTMPLGSVVDDGLQRLNVGDVHRSDIEAESAIGELVSARLEPGLIDIQYLYPRIIGCHHLRDAQPQDRKSTRLNSSN